MNFIPLQIPGSFRIQLDPFSDPRGYFVRTYDREFFERNNLITEWVQESQSFSLAKGTIRGLHFQAPPHSETKLVRAGQGKFFIVLLDIRPESSMFGKWVSVEISSDNNELLYVPKRIAMGMCTLSDNCSLLYKMDVKYNPESGRTILWNDPELNISWPVEGSPVISEKDRVAPGFRQCLQIESFDNKS